MAAINGAGVYVDLDLPDCTMAGTVFDPGTPTGAAYVTGMVLPDAAESIQSGSCGNSTFRYFTGLESVEGSGITAVGEYAFRACDALETVSLPAAKTIGNSAFSDCSDLKAVSLPASLTELGTAVFTGCTGLTTITVDPANPSYRSQGGMLLNKIFAPAHPIPAAELRGITGAPARPLLGWSQKLEDFLWRLMLHK
jgi:hypothetical protein